MKDRLAILLLSTWTTLSFTRAQSPATGSLDTTFEPPGPGFSHLLPLADGKCLVAGEFQFLGGTPLNRLARLNVDGSVDQAFDSGEGIGPVALNGIALQLDRRIILYGDFREYRGATRHHLARLLVNGALDETFNPPTDLNAYNSSVHISALKVDHVSRSIYVGGRNFQASSYGSTSIARLNPDGSIDASYKPKFLGDSLVDAYALELDDQGRLVLGGQFFNNTYFHAMVRLRADGTVDPTFKRVIVNDAIASILVQPDGRILIGGRFTQVNQQPRLAIARLNADGSRDVAFHPSADLGIASGKAAVSSMVLQGDGRLVVGGTVTPTAGFYTLPWLQRLAADGTRDPDLDLSFDLAGAVGHQSISALAMHADGKLTFSGNFRVTGKPGPSACGRIFTNPGVGQPFVSVKGDEARFRLQVHPGVKFIVETTPDLALPWRILANTNPLVSGVWSVNHSATDAPVGFFRVR